MTEMLLKKDVKSQVVHGLNYIAIKKILKILIEMPCFTISLIIYMAHESVSHGRIDIKAYLIGG